MSQSVLLAASLNKPRIKYSKINSRLCQNNLQPQGYASGFESRLNTSKSHSVSAVTSLILISQEVTKLVYAPRAGFFPSCAKYSSDA